MDPELLKARRFMQDKIFQFLVQRQPRTNEITQRKIFDIVRRLEEGLFNTAATKEEYLNLDTLESRLRAFIKRPHLSRNNTQPSQFVNSFAPVGTMIPTPGMPQNGNSNLMISSSVDSSAVSGSTGNSISSSIGSSVYLLPTANGSCTAVQHGGSLRTSDDNIIPSLGGQRLTSQMIPTPGFSSSSSNSTFVNMESASNGSDFSNVDSSLAPQ